MSGGFCIFVLSMVNNRDGSDKSYVSKRVYSVTNLYGGLHIKAGWSTLGLLIRLQRIGVPTCYLECVYISVDNNMINISPPNNLAISVSFIILQR